MPDQTLNNMGNPHGHGLEGFILIGGGSSRMGSDKAWLELGGSTFVERIAAALSSVAETVCCVGAKKDNLPGVINVPDLFPGWGALGGLHAALAAAGSDWSAV